MSMELSDAERARLLNPNGERNGDAEWYDDIDPDGEYVTCHRCGYRWQYTGNDLRAHCPVCRTRTRRTDDGKPAPRGIRQAECNAVREAAHDGLSYGEIAHLFRFLSTRAAASRHARGVCQHGSDGVPPVEGHRDGGFDNGLIDERECRRLREGWADGEFENYVEAGEAVGVHRTTAANHIKGECSHGGDDGR